MVLTALLKSTPIMARRCVDKHLKDPHQTKQKEKKKYHIKPE